MRMSNVTFTYFNDLSASDAVEYTTSQQGFFDWLHGLPEYPNKAACPLISLNRYDGSRTAKGAVRSNASIAEVAGVIGDYDAGDLAPEDAAGILQAVGVQAFIVTTPSHGIKGHRWRVILPFAESVDLEQRHQLLGRVNTILGGVLAGESFTASQAFYVGRVAGVVYGVWQSKGAPLDQLTDVEHIPFTGPERASRAAAAYDSFAMIPKRATGGTDQIRATLAAIPNVEQDWERWNRIGMAIFNASGGSDEGLEAWREWSDRCPTDGGDTVDARWRHYKTSPPTELGMGTLVHLAGGLVMPVATLPAEVPVPPIDQPISVSYEPELVSGFQFLAITQQIEHFKGCVYVQDIHRVFTPKGVLLKPEQFKATYGGYVFALDSGNDKVTKSAWEAFTESQGVRYAIAEGQTFRPELKPGEMTEEEGQLLVNTFVPVKARRRAGDASRFIELVEKLLPDERDRRIALSYMAACVQHIGVKFQWAPLFQGTEGNGKTTLTRCVAHAVGMKYCHFPKADQVGKNFNSWMMRKLVIGIEDVYYPDGRHEIVESLKPLITNDWLPIEPKGVDQLNVHVCANFLLNSNHLDAIRKTRNDRRYCVFYTAQQSAEDVERDGMGGDYFPDLYAWLRDEGGYAIVADFLAKYQIDEEFNPAGRCHRAPTTSSTEQAIMNGLGSVEQEILEAVSEGRQGFAGGWISSIALNHLLESRRMARAVPPNKRRGMLQMLGYDWHPGLADGRVNNPTALDGGGRPRLFIKSGHPDINLQKPAEIARRYEEAQQSRLAGAVFGND